MYGLKTHKLLDDMENRFGKKTRLLAEKYLESQNDDEKPELLKDVIRSINVELQDALLNVLEDYKKKSSK
jgi:hypothetical protein